MRRKAPIAILAAFAAFAAIAANRPFEIVGEWAASVFDTESISTPKALENAGLKSLSAMLTYVDNTGNVSTKEFDVDPNNMEESIEEALRDIRNTVNTATENAARALARVATLASLVWDNAQKIEQILSALVNVFSQLATIEIKDENTGETKNFDVKAEPDRVVLIGGLVDKSVPVDGLSVTSNSQNRIQVGDFEIADINTIPVKRELSGELSFTFLPNIMDIGLFDFIDEINHYTTIKGFYDDHAAGGSFGFCADSLAQQLTRQADDHSHFMLSVYFDGANHHLHYTPVGVLTNLAAATDSPWSWDARSGTFRNPWVQVANRTITATGAASGDGSYYVAVDMAQGTAVLTKGTTPASDDNMAYFTIGTVEGGKLTSGIKSMPVCIYWQ